MTAHGIELTALADRLVATRRYRGASQAVSDRLHQIEALEKEERLRAFQELVASVGLEFVAVTSRRRGGGVPLLPPEAAAARARDLMVMFPALARPDQNSVLAALAEAVAGRASWWDAMLAATLAGAGCTVLLSEDMHDG